MQFISIGKTLGTDTKQDLNEFYSQSLATQP